MSAGQTSDPFLTDGSGLDLRDNPNALYLKMIGSANSTATAYQFLVCPTTAAARVAQTANASVPVTLDNRSRHSTRIPSTRRRPGQLGRPRRPAAGRHRQPKPGVRPTWRSPPGGRSAALSRTYASYVSAQAATSPPAGSLTSSRTCSSTWAATRRPSPTPTPPTCSTSLPRAAASGCRPTASLARWLRAAATGRSPSTIRAT